MPRGASGGYQRENRPGYPLPFGGGVATLRHGFTLVELLITINVLVLLAALLCPVLSQLRARSRQNVCANNLHQIAQAGLMYVDDYDQRFPSCYWQTASSPIFDPSIALQPYLKNWAAFYCPERQTVRSGCLDPREQFRPNARCLGYGYNWGSGLGWSGSEAKGDGLVRHMEGGVAGVGLAEVTAPSHCLFFGDTNDSLFFTLLRDAMPGVRMGDDPKAGTNNVGSPYEPPRHCGGNNFAFVDGHLQWLRFVGGRWSDGGPWIVPDMSMYSRTGRWESEPVP